MNIKKAISLAKSGDEKRVGFNLQIPATLKAEFEHFCKANNVKVTAMILALMQTALDDDLNGNTNHDTLVSLQNTIISMNQAIEIGLDESDIGIDPILVKKAAERKLNMLAGINPDEE